MDCYDENKDKIIDYIKQGEKGKDSISIGLEVEHIIVHGDTLKSVTYDEVNGIKLILEKLIDKGWENYSKTNEVMSLKKKGDNITLEPGAQIEISIFNSISLIEIEKRYFNFYNDIMPILEEYGYNLLCIGYHPVSKVEDIPFIPKERYKYMGDYLKETGKYAHNMMKGTASLQVSIDYLNEVDYIKKYRVANFLSPWISFLIDNSPVFEGEIWEGNIPRVNIWNQVDNDRCRLINGILDKSFGYEDYSEYVLNHPCVISLLDDKYINTREQLVKDIYCGRNMSDKEIEHIMSMFFPDARTKRFIEIRMADSVPFPYSMSVAAMWKSLMYNDENLEYFYQLSLGYKNQDIQDNKDNLIRGDEKALDMAREFIKDILSRGLKGLSEEEKHFLKPLISLNSKYINLAHKIKIESTENFKQGILNNTENHIPQLLKCCKR